MKGPNAPVHAPTPGRPTLLRARLLERMGERWRVPLVAVLAGAGFGKTTLLAQALSDNAADPHGTDHWFSCRADDVSASSFAARLFATIGGVGDAAGGVEPLDLANVIAGRAPRHECVVIDDAHRLGPGGVEFLMGLLDVLPSNAHVVVSSRPGPRLPLAKLRAGGQAVLVAEADLAFDESESAAFAAMRVVDPGLVAGAAGWPALAELLATADRDAAMEFLWDELLATLPDVRRSQLAVLSALGRADDRLLSAAVGSPVAVRDVVRSLPLASVTADGWAGVHDLWGPALASVLGRDERDAALERAARTARDDHRLGEAFRLFAAASRWDQARAVVRDACMNSHPLVSLDELSTWHTRLLDGDGTSPELSLLRGVVLKQTSPDDAVLCLRHAAAAYGDADDRDEEASCLFHLGHMFWWANRNDELGALIGRVAELAAAGSWLATSMLELGHALLSEVTDPAPLLATVDVGGSERPLHPEIVPLRCWILARNQLFAGDSRSALLTARASAASATPTMRAVSEFLVLQCAWTAALPGARAAVLDRLDATLAAVRREGWLHFTVADLALGAMWRALDGRHDDARRLLVEATSIPQLASVWSEAVVGIARAVLASTDGDDVSAAVLLAEEVSRHPLAESSADLAHRPWLALSYVLVASTRSHWDGVGLRGEHELAWRCARALVALRDHRHSDALHELPDGLGDQVEQIRGFLPTPWLGQLAALVLSGGHERDAHALLAGSVASARPSLVALAGGAPGSIAESANRLLRTVATVPRAAVAIAVLGPLRMHVDGVETWPAELNRRVVRDLLLVLVEFGPLTRERLAALLWPDDDTGAQVYLRRTLSYLNRALEPHRADGEAPYFLEERGEQLNLRCGDHLSIDADQFDESLKEAARAEADGALDRTVAALLRGIELYRGDYASDAGLAEWALPARERRRVQFVNACVRAGSLLAARGDADRAGELATRAIRTEPWSEAARTLLAEAHLLRGDYAAARRAIDDCETMLTEIDCPPSAELRMLRRRLSAR